MVSMDRRMQSMQSDIKRLNQRASGDEPRKSMRSQIPCESIDQLSLIEEELTENRLAFGELVSLIQSKCFGGGNFMPCDVLCKSSVVRWNYSQ